MTFYDGSTVLETRVLSGGQASFTTALLGSGVHALKVFYPGDNVTFAPSTSELTQTVTGLHASGFTISDSLQPQGGYTGPAVVGDFNGDGKTDLAAVLLASLDIFIGKGDGTFPTALQTAADGPVSLATGDFNGDGITDIVSAQTGFLVLLGRGDGTFSQAPPIDFGAFGGEILQKVVAADFNGDGKVDLAVSVAYVPGIEIFEGNGDGTFQPVVNYPGTSNSGPGDMVVGDFNGDGLPDIAATSFDTGGFVSVLLNNGKGFQAAIDFLDAGNSAIATGDLNGDGKLDLVITNSGYTVDAFLGNGNGTFQEAATIGGIEVFPYNVAVGDLDGDGKPDVVVGETNVFQVLIGKGDGTLDTPVNYSYGSNIFEGGNIVIADLNRDGRNDIYVGGSVFLGKPTGGAPTSTTITAAKNPVATGDNITLTASAYPPAATGSVTFYEGSTVIGTLALSGGTTTLVAPNAKAGSHSLYAAYSGDSVYGSSASSTLVEEVLQALTPGAPVPNALTPNLLVDPGAESGLMGWYASSSESTVVAGSSHTGNSSFSGKQVPTAFITQTIKLTQVTGITLNQVDAGDLAANYSFWFADTSPGSGSHGEITLTFEDANGTILGQGVSSSLRNDTTQSWLNGTGSFSIPTGTRIVNYTMDFLTSSSANTGLMDDNTLTIAAVNH